MSAAAAMMARKHRASTILSPRVIFAIWRIHKPSPQPKRRRQERSPTIPCVRVVLPPAHAVPEAAPEAAKRSASKEAEAEENFSPDDGPHDLGRTDLGKQLKHMPS